MNLAIQATRYMIWLQSALGVLVLVLGIWYGDKSSIWAAFLSVISVFFLYVVLKGLQKELFWIAVPFAAFLTIDFLGAISGGVSFGNSANLADAVLSFVAVCGIVIWLRERGSLKNKDQSV
jgi:uncharacterized membrane protein